MSLSVAEHQQVVLDMQTLMCLVLLSNPPQDLSEDEGTGLSPGLCYLEQVCQMLEEFAQQQRHNQAVQRQREAQQTRLGVGACQAEPLVELSRQVGFVNSPS